MRRDFNIPPIPSCFGESGLQIADSSAESKGNTVTYVYQTHLQLGPEARGKPCTMTVVWSGKSMPGLSITAAIALASTDTDGAGAANGFCNATETTKTKQLSLLDIKMGPGPPWQRQRQRQWKRKGSRTLSSHHQQLQLHVFWDLSAARFGPASGPEPSEGFYVVVVCGLQILLLLGDLPHNVTTPITMTMTTGPAAVCVAKKQHVYGNKLYATRACFCHGGRCHDIAIECNAGTSGSKEPCLEIRVDRRRVLQVKRLPWKFRGNQTIVVDGFPVEVLWDVHSWLFAAGPNAVFMFHTGPGTGTADTSETHLGFSLLLYAWKVR